MGKYSTPRWGEWSVWAWHDQYNCWYRVRQDDSGHLDYQWDQHGASVQGIPRSQKDGGIDGITQAMGTTSLSRSPDEPANYTLNPSNNYDAYGSAVEPLSTDYGPPKTEIEVLGGYPRQDTTLDYSGSAAGDTLDPKYGVMESSDFRPGRILKVYWSEPKGSRKKATTISNGQEVFRLGELVYQGFRRFVVIANDQGHALCVPILTYESRACTKPGIKPNRHGIIYDERKKPKMLPKEPDLGFKPVRAKMEEETETLAKESRINYSKTSSIEHNAPVWFVGEVHPDDFKIVKKAYEKCWDRMTQEHKGESSRRHRTKR